MPSLKGEIGKDKSDYKVNYEDIEKKIHELENMVDDSRFTKITVTSKYGWKFDISHAKRDKIFMDTGKIEKFVPEEVKNQQK